MIVLANNNVPYSLAEIDIKVGTTTTDKTTIIQTEICILNLHYKNKIQSIITIYKKKPLTYIHIHPTTKIVIIKDNNKKHNKKCFFFFNQINTFNNKRKTWCSFIFSIKNKKNHKNMFFFS